MQRFAFCLLGLLTATIIGCDNGPPLGSVAGTVTYKSSPLSGVDVNIVQGANAAQTRTDEQGKFTVDGTMPTGDYKVYFTSPPPEPINPSVGKKNVAPPIKLPKKYQDISTTDVTVTIKTGANNFPIDLKD